MTAEEEWEELAAKQYTFLTETAQKVKDRIKHAQVPLSVREYRRKELSPMKAESQGSLNLEIPDTSSMESPTKCIAFPEDIAEENDEEEKL